MKTATFLTAMEIANILGVSRSTGYKIVSILNSELKDKGYITQTSHTQTRHKRR